MGGTRRRHHSCTVHAAEFVPDSICVFFFLPCNFKYRKKNIIQYNKPIRKVRIIYYYNRVVIRTVKRSLRVVEKKGSRTTRKYNTTPRT